MGAGPRRNPAPLLLHPADITPSFGAGTRHHVTRTMQENLHSAGSTAAFCCSSASEDAEKLKPLLLFFLSLDTVKIKSLLIWKISHIFIRVSTPTICSFTPLDLCLSAVSPPTKINQMCRAYWLYKHTNYIKTSHRCENVPLLAI